MELLCPLLREDTHAHVIAIDLRNADPKLAALVHFVQLVHRTGELVLLLWCELNNDLFHRAPPYWNVTVIAPAANDTPSPVLMVLLTVSGAHR